MYGPGKAWTDAIREFKGGRLLAKNLNAPITESFPADNTIRLPYANPPPHKITELRTILQRESQNS